MLKKFLKEAVVLITGRQAEDVVDLLDSNKHVNEFVIAKKLDLTINQTRNILYKISDHGLVSSIRKKDKRKGWYTYFWKIETLKALEFLKDGLVKKINQIEHQVKSRETKRFYVCERCHIELAEENALLHDFTCNECGDILTLKDNTKVIREMRKNLDRLKKDLSFVDEEVRKESEKVDKKKEKERKKETATKKKVRRLKREERKKEKEKSGKSKPKSRKKGKSIKSKAKKKPKAKKKAKKISKPKSRPKTKAKSKKAKKTKPKPKTKSKKTKKSGKKSKR
jgi:transcription factor E